MPVTYGERIYIGETFWFRIPDVLLNGVALTNLNPPDSFVYDVKDSAGAALAPPVTGNMVYNVATTTWEVEIAAPLTAGVYHVHATAIDGLSNGKWHDWLSVRAFT